MGELPSRGRCHATCIVVLSVKMTLTLQGASGISERRKLCFYTQSGLHCGFDIGLVCFWPYDDPRQYNIELILFSDLEPVDAWPWRRYQRRSWRYRHRIQNDAVTPDLLLIWILYLPVWWSTKHPTWNTWNKQCSRWSTEDEIRRFCVLQGTLNIQVKELW